MFIFWGVIGGGFNRTRLELKRVQSRKSGVMSLEWEIDRGKAKSRLAKFIQDLFNDWDIYQIMSDILEAPLYGFQPIEVVWEKMGSYLLPAKVEAKPPEWFQFDAENQLRYAPPYQLEDPPPGMKKDNIGYFIPPYKFLLPRYNATYYNPYGERILARVFWPVTFKKGGLKFWVIFSEKYGMPYIIGKHPRGIGDDEIQNLADSLDAMIQDAVAAIPDDSSIELVEAAGKSASADVYRNLIELCNAEISKAILGQTLTTEVGGRGSYAASKTHFDVRQDIIDADKRLVENTLNELIHWIVEINFGNQQPPQFILYEEEEVDKTLAERDQILANTGVRFTKDYFLKAYGFEDGDIELPSPPGEGLGVRALLRRPPAAPWTLSRWWTNFWMPWEMMNCRSKWMPYWSPLSGKFKREPIITKSWKTWPPSTQK